MSYFHDGCHDIIAQKSLPKALWFQIISRWNLAGMLDFWFDVIIPKWGPCHYLLCTCFTLHGYKLLMHMFPARTIFQATERAHRCWQAWAATSIHVVHGSAKHSRWWWRRVSSRQMPPALTVGELLLTISWHTTVRRLKICSVSTLVAVLNVYSFSLVNSTAWNYMMTPVVVIGWCEDIVTLWLLCTQFQ